MKGILVAQYRMLDIDRGVVKSSDLAFHLLLFRLCERSEFLLQFSHPLPILFELLISAFQGDLEGTVVGFLGCVPPFRANVGIALDLTVRGSMYVGPSRCQRESSAVTVGCTMDQ